MSDVKFQEMLAEKRGTPLYGDWFWKYQHVERMGHLEVTGLLDGEVYLQTKIDGANLSVAWNPEVEPTIDNVNAGTGLLIASRNHLVTDYSFNGAVEYIKEHPFISQVVALNNWILRGEWMIRHSVSYSQDAYKQFYVFDVQTLDGEYIHPDVYIPVLELYQIKYVPIRAKFTNPTLEDLLPHVTGPDEFGAVQKEGIVIKRIGFRNRFGRCTWGKLVSADFKEKNKLTFGGTKHDPAELNFIARTVTFDLIEKTILKIKDSHGGEISVRNMSELLQRVWYDVFTEELWTYVNKNKVEIFNFYSAKKLCDTKVRDVALAYFNGVPMVSIRQRKAELDEGTSEDRSNNDV